MPGLTCTLWSMTEHDPTEASQATARALKELRAAVGAVDAISDPQQALERAGDLADSLRATSHELDEIRVRKAAAIAKAEELSLAHLADRVATSNARSGRRSHPRRPRARVRVTSRQSSSTSVQHAISSSGSHSRRPSEVGPGRPTGVSIGGSPRPASRTGRAPRRRIRLSTSPCG
jgi:hypothetical protein